MAREALPARCLEAVLGWSPGTADAKLLETPARQVIVEEPAGWHQGEARYRLYHESFAELVRGKLQGGLSELHRRLAEQVAAWPPVDAGDTFVRAYALRHGIAHRAEAARDEAAWRALERYCLDVGYLRDAAVGAGPLALETSLGHAAERCPVEPVARTLTDLGRALIQESHWLYRDPHALPDLLWNQLLSRRWSLARLQGEARWPRGKPSYRLYRPLQRVDQSLRIIPTQGGVPTCLLLPDGRLVAGSDDRTLRIWDLETGRLESTLYGAHGFLSLAVSNEVIVAGDDAGNVWFLTERPFQSDPRGEPTPQPSPPRGPSTLRFLHLTDWHVGMAEQGWLWPNVREPFFDDLARLHQRLGGFDAVFFTGDLTQRGSADEFAKLNEALGAIWQRLAELGSDPVLVAVPGNHDLQRPDELDPAAFALTSSWLTNDKLRERFWKEEAGPFRQCVRTAFAPYAAWVERQPAMKRAVSRWGALPGDVAAVVERGGLRVGVVGLNSAFLQLTGADYDQRLDLDVRQIHAACGSDAPAWLAQNDLNLLLTHHPPSWLEPERKRHCETEIAPPGRFALHLHGHLHEPNAYAEAVGGSRPRHRLAGPSLFGLERFEGPGSVSEQRIHGYTAGRIDLTTSGGASAGKPTARVRLWPRRLVTKRSGAPVMERDGEFELDDDDSFPVEVPCKGRPGTP